jgi:hypothetical protein
MRETSKVSAGPLSPKIYGDRDVLKTPRNEILAPEVELCLPRLLRLARYRASGDCGPSAGVLAAGPVTGTLLLYAVFHTFR